jgi:hypothetical protein
MSKLTSFAADILPLFTQRDIQGMSKAFNLASYDDVKAHAAAIFDRIRGIGGASVSAIFLSAPIDAFQSSFGHLRLAAGPQGPH